MRRRIDELGEEEEKVNERLTEIRDTQAKAEAARVAKLKEPRRFGEVLTVTVDDIQETVEKMSGVPIRVVEQNVYSRLANIEERMGEVVVGHSDAISKLADAVRTRRIGQGDPNRPAGSFILFGPSGNGKTLLAKALGDALGLPVFRYDMSDYQQPHTVSRLMGAPPGYVGYDEGGELTKRVKRNPQSVVLLDEIEKAHPDIYDPLLQILEEGELKDARNPMVPVDFRNAILVMTSNIAKDGVGKGRMGFDQAGKDTGTLEELDPGKAALRDSERFRPEFLNRVDEAIYIGHLSREETNQVLDKEIRKIEKRFNANGDTLEVIKDAREILLQLGFLPEYGGRFLARLFILETSPARCVAFSNYN